MSGPAAAGAGAGALLSAYGQFQASRAEAKLLRRRSNLLDLSADQILELNDENTRLIRDDIKKTQGAATTKFAAAGVGTDLEALADIARIGEQEIRIRTDEAEWNAEMKRIEARITRDNARATRRAGTISAISTILSGGGKAASVAGK